MVISNSVISWKRWVGDGIRWRNWTKHNRFRIKGWKLQGRIQGGHGGEAPCLSKWRPRARRTCRRRRRLKVLGCAIRGPENQHATLSAVIPPSKCIMAASEVRCRPLNLWYRPQNDYDELMVSQMVHIMPPLWAMPPPWPWNNAALGQVAPCLWKSWIRHWKITICKWWQVSDLMYINTNVT